MASGDEKLLTTFESLALAAGRRIMEVLRAGPRVEHKADASPVTQADRDAEAIILAGLRAALPGMPVVAEEETSAGIGPDEVGETFLLVDPLDGTREFVAGRGDFTVNIALVRDHVPALGVVFAPARGLLYAGGPGGAQEVHVDPGFTVVSRRPIRVREPAGRRRVVASRSHRTPQTDAFIARLAGVEIATVGSSLKFCMLAAGEADLYPRLGPTMQWDTAAGDAVLRAAGGHTLTTHGSPLRYGAFAGGGDAAFANPHFVASGGQGAGAVPTGATDRAF